MTADELPFRFTDERPRSTSGTLVVRIPRGFNRKRKVLAKFASQLSFPPYFGWNWDAFEECLNDLSWLDGASKVIVVHRDVPFARSPEQCQTYLSILQCRAGNSSGVKFDVYFPRSTQAIVRRVLADDPSDASEMQ